MNDSFYLGVLVYLPQYIYWPGHGRATRIRPLTIADYEKANGTAIYKTEDGHVLRYRFGIGGPTYKCQFDSQTTMAKDSLEEAFSDLERRLGNGTLY